MPQNVPRRLMRFYREGGSGAQNQETVNVNYTEKSAPQEEDPFSPNGRPILAEIPSMSYEDLEKNKKNYEEIKHIEETNMEEKLALEEVDRFKKTHNRMPTKEESDKIADNLYTQLKNVDTNALYSGTNSDLSEIPSGVDLSTGGNEPQGGRRSRRDQRANAKNQAQAQMTGREAMSEAKIPAQYPSPSTSEITDVKSLLEEDSGKKEKKQKAEDDFDLGLGDELSTAPKAEGISEEEDIESINLNENETCPTCKKETEKIIYCSKCGTAFCNSCAKKEGTTLLCPKCGTKTKT